MSDDSTSPPASRKLTMRERDERDGLTADQVMRKNERARKQAERRRLSRSTAFRELLSYAHEHDIYVHSGTSTAHALQLCLDRAVALWQFAAHMTDSHALDPAALDDPDDPSSGGFFELVTGPAGAFSYVPNRWYVSEREARQDVEKLAALMTSLGIAERQVRVQEAQSALIVARIRDVAIKVGLSPDQVRLLGEGLRDSLSEAHADITVAPSTQQQAQARRTATGRSRKMPLSEPPAAIPVDPRPASPPPSS